MSCFVISCGKKNKVNKKSIEPPPYTPGTATYNPGLSPEQNSKVANTIAGIQCNYHGVARTGHTRVTFSFKANTPVQPGQNTTLLTTWTQGKVGGQVYKTFLGRTNEGDVMAIFQTASGYDMDLHLCTAQNNLTETWLIGGSAQLSNFLFTGYNLDSDVNCGNGSIDAGSFSFFSNTAGNVSKLVAKICWK